PRSRRPTCTPTGLGEQERVRAPTVVCTSLCARCVSLPSRDLTEPCANLGLGCSHTGRSAVTTEKSSDGRGATSFAETLSAAIRDRGLTLSRLHARLVARGNPVSMATLSYWRS